MKDNPNWRNHRWSLDGQYCEVEAAPTIAAQIQIHGMFWDGEKFYKFHGHGRYIVRWPDFRKDYRIPMEKPRDPFQRELL